MPGYKSIWSSVAYHAITAPAIRTAKHKVGEAITKLKHRANLRRGIGHGLNPARKAKVRSITRGSTAGNSRLWSKTTQAGIQRRQAAAKLAKATPRPLRTHNRPSKAPSVAPKVNRAKVALVRSTPPGSVQAALHTSRTHGQLRRKLTGLAVRKTTRSMVAHPTNSPAQRKMAAQTIKAIRKFSGGKRKAGKRTSLDVVAQRVKKVKEANMRSAARTLANHKKP